MQFDSPAQDSAVLTYRRPTAVTVAIILQALAWLVMVRIALAEQGIARRWRSGRSEPDAILPPDADGAPPDAVALEGEGQDS